VKKRQRSFSAMRFASDFLNCHSGRSEESLAISGGRRAVVALILIKRKDLGDDGASPSRNGSLSLNRTAFF